MNRFKKIIMIGVASSMAMLTHAELKELEDTELKKTTGKAGLTIDISTKWSIGEIAWKDGESGGSVLVQGIRMGGGKYSLPSDVPDMTYVHNGEQSN